MADYKKGFYWYDIGENKRLAFYDGRSIGRDGCIFLYCFSERGIGGSFLGDVDKLAPIDDTDLTRLKLEVASSVKRKLEELAINM